MKPTKSFLGLVAFVAAASAGSGEDLLSRPPPRDFEPRPLTPQDVERLEAAKAKRAKRAAKRRKP